MRSGTAIPVSARRGFTLVEAVATITIVATIAAVVSSIFFSAISSYRDTATRARLDNEVSSALDRAVRMLRSISNKSTSAAPDIGAVTASSITWETAYSLTLSSGSLVYVGKGGVSQTLLTGVSAFTVSAFDQDNNAMAATLSGSACDSIRRLSLTLTATSQGVSYTLRTRVFVRSTMTEAG